MARGAGATSRSAARAALRPVPGGPGRRAPAGGGALAGPFPPRPPARLASPPADPGPWDAPGERLLLARRGTGVPVPCTGR